MKRRRVLILTHPDFVPPASLRGVDERERHQWKTEHDVLTTLRAEGHGAEILGVQDEIQPIREAVEQQKPHIVFNLLEEFHGNSLYDQNVVGFLELLRVPYTGCNPRGMVLARGKALSKKLLAYHRIPVPGFLVLPRRRPLRRPPRLPARLAFPLIVKTRTEEASYGIAQASVVDTPERLLERVQYLHENLETDAIVEEYIEGRELYVAVLGNHRLTVFPTWELLFEKLPRGRAAIATARVKHDPQFQERWGIFQQRATRLPRGVREGIERSARRIYRILQLDGYARLDFRLRDDGRLYFLEANPNPDIARSEEFASAAEAAGWSYPELLTRILSLGLRRHAETA